MVHLPIGILLLAFMMQLLQWWKKKNNFEEAIKFSLLIATIFSVLAIVTGWRLAGEGGYEADSIWWHKWLGVATGIATMVLYLSKIYTAKFLNQIYAPIFFITIGLLSVAGHKGANITHGADYLFSYPTDRSITVEDINTANAFETVIYPILDAKCISCHNPSKLKRRIINDDQRRIIGRR